MNAQIRSAFVVAVVFLVVVYSFAAPLVGDPAGLRELIRGLRRGEELQQFQRITTRHFKAKEHVVREVIAQRCSLSKALARLQELDYEWIEELERDWPDSAIGISEGLQQKWSDTDHYYRSITALAEELLGSRSDEAAAVLRRLGKEYQRLQASRQPSSIASSKHRENIPIERRRR